MDWLTEVIKQLQTSRAFVTAVFMVCLCLLLGYNFVPNLIPQLPTDWKLPLIGGLLFSGTLLTFIIISFSWRYISKVANHRVKKIKSLRLSKDDQIFLYSLALMIESSKDDFVNLNNLNYQAMEASRIELQETSSHLSFKGLINLNSYDSNLISLTDDARRKALEIKKNIAK